MGIVFVGGVHAVGKTTICQKVGSEINIPHYSASDLIKSESASKFSRKGISVINMKANQNLLLDAINKLPTFDDPVVLLDGHFTLVDEKENIKNIDLEVFQNLNIRGIIVLCDQVKNISSRFEMRDGEKLSQKFVLNYQEQEVNQGKQIAELMKVPILLVMVSEDATIIPQIRNFIFKIQESYNV